MKQIPPIPLKDKYWREIQREIERIFNEVLFIPLYKAVGIPVKEVRNAPSTPLEKAIAEGKVWYEDKQFKGTFNAAISKEIKEMGGKWNAKSKTWSYAATLPAGVSMAIAAASFKYEAMRQAVLTTLSDMNIESIDRLANYGDPYSQTIRWMNDDWVKALKGITVAPQLTDDEVGFLTAEYSQNLDLYVKKWTEESILKMRQIVQDQTFAGRRPESIAKMIQHEFSVSRSKAKFLASQETRLLLGSFHESRARSVGSQFYIWRGRLDQKERHDHRILEGKKIFWDSPPVVDLRTGRRAHAGCDYNCRCVSIAVIE